MCNSQQFMKAQDFKQIIPGLSVGIYGNVRVIVACEEMSKGRFELCNLKLKRIEPSGWTI